jgi:hypothetical protein
MHLIIPPADDKSARFPTTSEQSDRARKCETSYKIVVGLDSVLARARLGIGMTHGGLGGDGNRLRFVR